MSPPENDLLNKVFMKTFFFKHLKTNPPKKLTSGIKIAEQTQKKRKQTIKRDYDLTLKNRNSVDVSCIFAVEVFWQLLLRSDCLRYLRHVIIHVLLKENMRLPCECALSKFCLSQLSSSCIWCIFFRISWTSSTFRTSWSTSCLDISFVGYAGYCAGEVYKQKKH